MNRPDRGSAYSRRDRKPVRDWIGSSTREAAVVPHARARPTSPPRVQFWMSSAVSADLGAKHTAAQRPIIRGVRQLMRLGDRPPRSKRRRLVLRGDKLAGFDITRTDTLTGDVRVSRARSELLEPVHA